MTALIFLAAVIGFMHVTTESLGLVTLVGLITIAMSVYMITYSHVLYRWLAPVLSVFERHNPFRETLFNETQEKIHSVLM